MGDAVSAGLTNQPGQYYGQPPFAPQRFQPRQFIGELPQQQRAMGMAPPPRFPPGIGFAQRGNGGGWVPPVPTADASLAPPPSSGGMTMTLPSDTEAVIPGGGVLRKPPTYTGPGQQSTFGGAPPPVPTPETGPGGTVNTQAPLPPPEQTGGDLAAGGEATRQNRWGRRQGWGGGQDVPAPRQGQGGWGGRQQPGGQGWTPTPPPGSMPRMGAASQRPYGPYGSNRRTQGGGWGGGWGNSGWGQRGGW